MPQEIEPMLAEPGAQLESNANWSFEPKLDGYRIIAFVDGDSVYLQSRRGQDYTSLFPELVAELKTQCVGSMILDGEVVALDPEGRPNFNLLQNRAHVARNLHLFRPAPLRRHQPARRDVRTEAPLLVAMFATHQAHPTDPLLRRW
jgi:bifunctional non-homologous end joining protein LigD